MRRIIIALLIVCLLPTNLFGKEPFTFLGPIFEYKKDESSKTYAFRPIFYYEADYELKFRSLDIIYPFIGYQEDNQQTQFKAFFSIIRYSNFNDYDNLQEKKFSIFPILDVSWSGKPENDYFSLFPIWGNLKEKYNKKEISYFLFPLYLKTVKKNSVNRHFLWPFFSKVDGKYVSGFKVWPLFGYETKMDKNNLNIVKKSRFILWPFYAYKQDTRGGINLEQKIFFPFYLSSNSSLHKSKTYLWPFFNIYTDKTRGQTTYNMPWPIIQYKQGVNIKSQRFFPFYSYVKTPNVEKGFYFWPIYRYKNEILATEYYKTQSFLFFLYRQDTHYDLRTNEISKEFSSLWPIYSKDTYADGYDFRIFSPIESFFSKNQKIKKVWSPMWSVLRIQDDSSVFRTSIFFNLIKYKNDKYNNTKEFSINFLIPIISHESHKTGTKFNILGGLLGLETGDKSKIRILYIPINI